MREIKFRLWNKNNSQMYDIGQLEFTSDVEISANDGLLVCEEQAILMQFTGLKDKNGKEIYEGDIVNYARKEAFCKNDKCDNKNELGIDSFCPSCGTKIKREDFITTSEIRFMEAAFVYYTEPSEETFQAWTINIAAIYIEWVEVVGNIHENPELLTDKPQS